MKLRPTSFRQKNLKVEIVILNCENAAENQWNKNRIFRTSQHSSREAFDYRPSPFNKKLTRFYIENKLDYRVERANFVLVWKRRYPNQLSIDFERILFCVRTTKSNFTFQLFTILALTSFSGRRMT